MSSIRPPRIATGPPPETPIPAPKLSKSGGVVQPDDVVDQHRLGALEAHAGSDRAHLRRGVALDPVALEARSAALHPDAPSEEVGAVPRHDVAAHEGVRVSQPQAAPVVAPEIRAPAGHREAVEGGRRRSGVGDVARDGDDGLRIGRGPEGRHAEGRVARGEGGVPAALEGHVRVDQEVLGVAALGDPDQVAVRGGGQRLADRGEAAVASPVLDAVDVRFGGPRGEQRRGRGEACRAPKAGDESHGATSSQAAYGRSAPEDLIIP